MLEYPENESHPMAADYLETLSSFNFRLQAGQETEERMLDSKVPERLRRHATSRVRNSIVRIENCKIWRSIPQEMTHQLISERRSGGKWVRIVRIINIAINNVKCRTSKLLIFDK